MIWDLPVSLNIAGREYGIDSDFRTVLRVLTAYGDPELSDVEKRNICLVNLYPGVDAIPAAHIPEAYEAAVRFIDNGQQPDGKSARTMDWEQDAALLFPAINNVARFEVRSVKYLHWWTFLGYFMEIRDGVFSTVLRLRRKRAKNQKLDKSESEFWRTNQKICVLEKKLTAAEQADYNRFNALFC